METTKSFFSSLFSSRSGSISSKRVCGFLIIIVILFSYVWAVITKSELPTMTGELMWVGATLLGIDSITRAFNKKE